MSEHAPRTIERHCDVAVIGGSGAGLAAALEVGRQHRSVIVIDAGEPPHASTAAVEREDVRSYGGEVLDGSVCSVTGADDGRFRLALTGGHFVVARRVLVATGMADESPDIGSRLGATIGGDLDEEDRRGGARPSANEADWDHRYGTAAMWSGNPNGTLVNEIRGLTPGRALDVGAGEGADALWLAEQGWRVTAADISQRALDRLGAEAARRGLDVECLHADANAVEPFEAGAFDLVSAQYASIPRTPDGRGVANLLGAVAPGGVLLVVSHDLEPMRTPIDTATHSRAFDPDAYVRVDDVAAALAGSPGWDVDLHEKRPRPAGAASASHHVEDVVFRARRVGPGEDRS